MKDTENKRIKELNEWLKKKPKLIDETKYFKMDANLCNYNEWELALKEFKCIRKNEMSKDEIRINMFWAEYKNGGWHIPGIIASPDTFSSESETHKLHLNMKFERKSLRDVFFLMIYEEDNPMLLDAHDPIGLIAFFQNQTFKVYSGDMNQLKIPVSHSYNGEHNIKFDADSKGEYEIFLEVNTHNN